MIEVLALFVGAAAGLATALCARRFGRAEPRIWATILVVMQAIYLAFALFAPDRHGLLREALILAAFTAIAVAGFRVSTWFLVFGMLAHGLWDLRHLLADDPYVLALYPELCIGYDWPLFFYLLIRARSWERVKVTPTAEEAA